MSDVVTLASKSLGAVVADQEYEISRLMKFETLAKEQRETMDAAHRALLDGHRGTAINLLRPKAVTAPIAAQGDHA